MNIYYSEIKGEQLVSFFFTISIKKDGEADSSSNSKKLLADFSQAKIEAFIFKIRDLNSIIQIPNFHNSMNGTYTSTHYS